MSDPERRPYNSGATIASTTMALPVDAGPLREKLELAGLSLAPVPGLAPGKHLLCVEMWHVEGGHIEGPFVDQHTWSQMAGWWCGAALAGPAGAMLGARMARRWSQETSRLVGTYEEVLVAVPNVLRRRGPAGRHYMFVLGMFSNGRASIWGDQIMGCGTASGWPRSRARASNGSRSASTAGRRPWRPS